MAKHAAAKSRIASVDAYLAAQPEAARAVLQRVREAIRKALPDADEVISYQIPAYRLPGGTVLFFAGWKEHYSLYPITGETIAAFAADLAPYEVNRKGTARFSFDTPVPVRLIGRIAKFRGADVRAKHAAKAKVKKSPG